MRIAQLTDLHLRHHLPGTSAINERRSRQMPRLLAGALAKLQEQSVDLLAVTGDLLDVPDWLTQPPPDTEPDEPQTWRTAALDDYRLIKQALDTAGLPYMALPGNHDAPDLFWQVFDRAAHHRQIGEHTIFRFCDHEHAGHIPRRFLSERQRWEQVLAQADSPAQIHLQHYLILPPIQSDYPYQYAEAEFLANQMAQSQRVQLSLSGHYHPGTALHWRGPTCFTAGPAFCIAPFRWRVYEVNPAEITFTEHALGDSAVVSGPVVFLDRDGVINDRAAFHGGPELMQLLPGVAAAIRRLNDTGHSVIVITNQSSVGRGLMSESCMHLINDKLCRLLAAEAGATLEAIYVATGAGGDAILPDYADVTRPKPRPTMLWEARDQLHLDLRGAWMIGDNITDALAATAAGVQPVLVRTGHGRDMEDGFRAEYPDAPVVADLAAAVDFILNRQSH